MYGYVSPGERLMFLFTTIFILLNGSLLAFNGYFQAFMMNLIAKYESIHLGLLRLEPSNLNNDLLKHALIMFGIGLVAIAASFIQRYSIGKIGQGISTKLKVQLLKKLLSKNTAFFNSPENSPGILTQRLSMDCDQAHQILSETTSAILQGLGSFVAGVVLSIIADWRIGLIGLANSPIIIANGLLHTTLEKENESQSDPKNPNSNKKQNSNNSDVRIFSESVANIITVMTLNSQDYILEKFKYSLKSEGKKGYLANILSSLLYGLGDSGFYFVTALYYFVGSKLLGRQTLEFRNFYSSMFSAAFGLYGVGIALRFLPDLGTSLNSARMVLELMDG